LEREGRRTTEVMWLLRGLTPGYRTIANFRRDNPAGLPAANRGLGLLGGELAAIDGAFFHGDASKAGIVTKKRLAEQIAALDRSIAEYGAALEANDKAEAAAAAKPRSAAEVAAILAGLRERRTARQEEAKRLAQSGEAQLSRTDPDARLLAKRGQIIAGYNVPIAVDAKHQLIAASEVINAGNDTGQLYAMAQAAKQALEVDKLTAVADAGYDDGESLKACEDNQTTAYVPPPDRGRRLKQEGRFSAADFLYDPAL
jgi:hypothetical protein